MKFSTAALLALANGIVAMPWSDKGRHSNEEITLRVKVSQPQTKHHAPVSKYDICWLLCASESIDCPEGWYASQHGECWTCCRSAEDYGL